MRTADEFKRYWPDTPFHVKDKFRQLLKHPTERNQCYVTGYVAALYDCGKISQGMYSFLIGLVDETHIHAASIREEELTTNQGEPQGEEE